MLDYKTLFFYFLFTLSFFTTLSTSAAQCAITADFLLLIDSSGSIDETEYEVERNFAINLVNGLNESFDEARFAVFQFSGDQVYTESHFTYNILDVISALEDMERKGGYTPFARGCNAAYNEFKDYPRSGVSKIFIPITDGAPTCCNDLPACVTACSNTCSCDGGTGNCDFDGYSCTSYRDNAKHWVDKMKNEYSARAIAVGVGVNSDTTNFLQNTIASSPSNLNYFAASAFDETLTELTNSIINSACFYITGLSETCTVINEQLTMSLYGSNLFGLDGTQCIFKYDDGTTIEVEADHISNELLNCTFTPTKSGSATVSIRIGSYGVTNSGHTIKFVDSLDECSAIVDTYAGGAVILFLMALLAFLGVLSTYMVLQLCKPVPVGPIVITEEETTAVQEPVKNWRERDRGPAAHYIWGGGMAAPMKVHWGDVAPPSAPVDGTDQNTQVNTQQTESQEIVEPEGEEEPVQAGCCAKMCPCFFSSTKYTEFK